MLKRESFTEEHIRALQKNSKLYINKAFTQPEMRVGKYLKKVDLEAYAYMIKADEVLAKIK